MSLVTVLIELTEEVQSTVGGTIPRQVVLNSNEPVNQGANQQAALLQGFSFKFPAWVPAQTSFIDELCPKSVDQINPFLPLIALSWSALSEKPDKTRTLCSCRDVRGQHAEVCSVLLGYGFQGSNLGCWDGSKHPYLQSQLVNLTCRTLKIFTTAVNISLEQHRIQI